MSLLLLFYIFFCLSSISYIEWVFNLSLFLYTYVCGYIHTSTILSYFFSLSSHRCEKLWQTYSYTCTNTHIYAPTFSHSYPCSLPPRCVDATTFYYYYYHHYYYYYLNQGICFFLVCFLAVVFLSSLIHQQGPSYSLFAVLCILPVVLLALLLFLYSFFFLLAFAADVVVAKSEWVSASVSVYEIFNVHVYHC